MWRDFLYHLTHPGSIPPFGWVIMAAAGALIVSYFLLLGRVKADNAREKAKS